MLWHLLVFVTLELPQMVYRQLTFLLAIVHLSACQPDFMTTRGRIGANSWACGNNSTLTFTKDGDVTATLQNSASSSVAYKSTYKIVEDVAGTPPKLELSDDKALRPIFGGSMSLTSFEIGLVDFHLILRTGGFETVCEPVKEKQ